MKKLITVMIFIVAIIVITLRLTNVLDTGINSLNHLLTGISGFIIGYTVAETLIIPLINKYL